MYTFLLRRYFISKNLGLLFFLQLAFLIGSSQTKFIKTYDIIPYEDETSDIMGLIQTADGGYMATIRVNFYEPPYYRIAKFNEFGDLIWIDTLLSDDYTPNIIEFSDETYVYTVSIWDSLTEKANMLIVNINDDGYVLDSFIIAPLFGKSFDDYTAKVAEDNSVVAIESYWELFEPGATYYVSKYLEDGTLDWSYDAGIDSNVVLSNIKKFTDGYLISLAQRYTNYDTPIATEKYWQHLIKLDFDGSVIFDFEIDSQHLLDAIEAEDGGVYCLMVTPSTDHEEFWPFNTNMMLQKRDMSGALIWENQFPELFSYNFKNMIRLSNGGFMLPAQGPTTESESGFINLMYFDSLGNYEYETSIGDGLLFHPRQTILTTDNGFILGGSLRESPLSNPYAVLHKTDSLGNSTNIKLLGKVFYDENDNNIFDENDIVLPSLLVHSYTDSLFATTDFSGVFTKFIYDTGTYNIKVNNPESFYQTWPTSDTINITVDSLTQIFDTLFIAKQTDVYTSDIQIVLDGGNPNPGFTKNYYVTINNKGVLPASDVVATIILDSAFNFVTSTPYYSSMSGDTVTYNIESITGFTNHQILMVLELDADTSLIGDTLDIYGSVINSILESDLTNNFDTLSVKVYSSYDPNHKSAIPAGETDLGYVDPATSHLEYKIEFQNLGNDSATFIVVYDTLSSAILFESFHMLSASHNYTLDFIYPNIVKWTFNNIDLPYSFIDEAGSQGFVKFEVDLQPGLPVGTQIKNNAAIYFDYNPAVITNTAYTTLQLYIPDFIAEDQLFQKVIVYPNPSDNQISFRNLPDGEFVVYIYDLNGVLMQTNNINSSQQYIAVNSLPSGHFIFQIKSNHNLVGSGKLIINK